MTAIQARVSRRRMVLAAGAALGTLAAPPPMGLAAEPVETFIGTLANQVLDIIVKDCPRAEKREAFRALLVARADIPAIAKFSLGRYARRLPERDRVDYHGLVAAYISNIFATHAVGLAGEAVTVTGSIRRSDRESLVSSKVRFASGRFLAVDWRVVEADGVYKVFDVSINGIWLAIQQRTEFMSVITRGGGKVEALLRHLRERAN